MAFYIGSKPHVGDDAARLLYHLRGSQWFGFIKIDFAPRDAARKKAIPGPLWIRNLHELMQAWSTLMHFNKMGFDIFFSHRDIKKRKKNGITEGLPFIDIDIDNVPINRREELCVRLQALPLPPTSATDTGGGIHIQYRLGGKVSPIHAPFLMRGLAEYIRDFIPELGYRRSKDDEVKGALGTIDYAHLNVGQGCRLPGTINQKADRGQQVQLVFTSEHTLSIGTAKNFIAENMRREALRKAKNPNANDIIRPFDVSKYREVVEAIIPKLVELGDAYWGGSGSLVCRCPCPNHDDHDKHHRSGIFDPTTGVLWCFRNQTHNLLKDITRYLHLDYAALSARADISVATHIPPPVTPGELYITPILRWRHPASLPLLFLIVAWLRAHPDQLQLSTHGLLAFAHEIGWVHFTAQRIGYLVRVFSKPIMTKTIVDDILGIQTIRTAVRLVHLAGNRWGPARDCEDHQIEITSLSTLLDTLRLKGTGPTLMLPGSAGLDIHLRGGAIVWRTYTLLADHNPNIPISLSTIAERLGYSTHTTIHNHLFGPAGLVSQHQAVAITSGKKDLVSYVSARRDPSQLGRRRWYAHIRLQSGDSAHFEPDLTRPTLLSPEMEAFIGNAGPTAEITFISVEANQYAVTNQALSPYRLKKVIDSDSLVIEQRARGLLPKVHVFVLRTLSETTEMFVSTVTRTVQNGVRSPKRGKRKVDVLVTTVGGVESVSDDSVEALDDAVQMAMMFGNEEDYSVAAIRG